MKALEKTNFGFGVAVCVSRFSIFMVQRMRMGDHHSVGIKMGVFI
jgi:hypothetical protein